jgi:hypothetical protein
MENIGAATFVVPALITYTSSLVYGAFALSLALYGEKPTLSRAFLSAGFICLAFIEDLCTFSRMGTLFCLFCYLGFLVRYKVAAILTPRRVGLILIILCLMSTSRAMRRAETGITFWQALTERQVPYLKVPLPTGISELVEAYVNYAVSPYALDSYLRRDHDWVYGQRTFMPLFRLVRRIGGGDEPYLTSIDENAAGLPMGYNVYTIVRDYYGDFGIIGVVFLAAASGILVGAAVLLRGVEGHAISIYAMAWLFYTPMYNAFSFGSFVIGFLFLLIWFLMSRRRSEVPTHPKDRSFPVAAHV